MYAWEQIQITTDFIEDGGIEYYETHTPETTKMEIWIINGSMR